MRTSLLLVALTSGLACADPSDPDGGSDGAVDGGVGLDAAPDASLDARVDAAIADVDPGMDADDAGQGDAANVDTGPVTYAQVRRIEVGVTHACAILVDDSVRCWGTGGAGQLGVNDEVDVENFFGAVPTPAILGPGQVVQLALGLDFSCARFADGTVKCWGANGSGQLGAGSTELLGDGPGEMEALVPIDLGTGRSAIMIDASYQMACALLDDLSVKCWGDNTFGDLGLGDTDARGDDPGEMGDALPAIDFGVGRTATMIAVGYRGGCAFLDDARIHCWGRNDYGQAGLGNSAAVFSIGDEPGEVAAQPGFTLGAGRTIVKIDGGNTTFCARLDDNSVKCWGEGISGTLGQGSSESLGDDPGEVGDALPAINFAGKMAYDISLFDETACAVFLDQSGACWGDNGSGQLGVGDTDYRGNTPGAIDDGLNIGTGLAIIQLAVGSSETCALFTTQRVKCWGAGLLGWSDQEAIGDDPSELGDALPFVDLGPP